MGNIPLQNPTSHILMRQLYGKSANDFIHYLEALTELLRVAGSVHVVRVGEESEIFFSSFHTSRIYCQNGA